MDFNITSQKINRVVTKAKSVLVMTHRRPDHDALGSFYACGEWLEKLNKHYHGFSQEAPGSTLPVSIKPDVFITNPQDLAAHQFDLIIVLDSGDLEHAGGRVVLAQLPTRPVIVNIDHHATNQLFGDYNLVQTQASSTTEILFRFFEAINHRLSANSASALLAGIVADTYNFTNPNTSAGSLEATSALLRRGAHLAQVSDIVSKNKSVNDLKLWGAILQRLTYHKKYGLVVTVITADDIKNQGDREVTEGIANFLNNLTGVAASLVLRQDSDQSIKGSLRTNSDHIDVSALAKLFGGGGHRKAAGFTIPGRLVITPDGWKIE